MISSALRGAIERALGRRVESLARLSGGDINDAFALSLAGGERVFLKTNQTAPAAMFPAEARGLRFLSETGTLRIPRVIAHSAVDESDPKTAPFLVLEFIASARPHPGFDQELGQGLAALHRAGAPSFGLDGANFIGRLPQSNQSHPTWAEFYHLERLEPQLRLAESTGRAPSELLRDFEGLLTKLPGLVGATEPPARLHGDLWAGNLHIDEQGRPCLIDPAVYGGHREMDLAMMRLFGGFSERVFAAYAESFPLSTGHAERVALYQLYPLLVHLNLFGKSYVGAVQRAISTYL